ncbi:MAG: PGPGW domain-containing protein [Nitrospirota bacterium]
MEDFLRSLFERLQVRSHSHAERLFKTVVGFTLLLAGIAMTVLPGPAVVVIPLALGILASEFLWARRLLQRFHREFNNLRNHQNNKRKKGERAERKD